MKIKKTESKKNIFSKRGFYFALSLALHGLLVVLLFLNPALDPDRWNSRKMTEVELIDPEQLLQALKKHQQNPNGQIVEQSEKAINDEKPEDAKFMSRHNQRVIRETQAAVHGKFKNTDGSRGDTTTTSQPAKKPNRLRDSATKELLADNDSPTIAGKKPRLENLMPNFRPSAPKPEPEAGDEDERVAGQGNDGPSATDDHLKNVETGMQTLLSTREFVYYTYYNRIKDKLRQYWEPKIKEKMERVMRQGRMIASSTDRITRIVITLDDKGTLMRVQVVGPSGLRDLDEAAIEAFRAAAPFPNPPKGIVDKDGTIKIRWDFILEANASGIVNSFRLARRPN